MQYSETKKGVIYTAVSFIMWGLFPLYWKLLEQLPALDILAHRIIWSFVFMCIVLFFLRQWKIGWQELRSLKKNGGILSLFLASILISINWFVYIWAVNHGFLLEASLGYYINPLVSVLLGILFLKEKLNRLQLVAVSIAAAGVIISAFQYGSIPYVALLLAFSFGLYGLSKKRTSLPSAIGLTLETFMIMHCIGVFTVQRTCSASGCRKRRDVAASLFGRCVYGFAALIVCGRSETAATVSSRYLTIYCADHYPADRAVCLP